MPTASANRLALRYIVESTYGVTPNTGNPNNLRNTGESLTFSIQTETSKEIRSDRQTSDLVQVGASASGGFNFELSYKEYDTLMQATLMDSWVVYGTNGVSSTMTLTIDSTANTLTASAAPTGSSAFTGIADGQFIRLVAPGDAANGAVLRVASKTSTVLTISAVTPVPGTGSRASVVSCTVSTSRLGNGSTMRSFSVEKGLLDVGQYFMYRGMNAAKMSLSFQSGAIVTGSVDFMGKDSVRATATGLPGTPVASATYDVINAVTGVGTLLENGAVLSGTFIKSLKLEVDNKLRGQDAIGVLGNAGIAPGTLMVSGELEVYLSDGALYDKFINNTASSLVWTAKDGANNGYALFMPRIKFGDAKVQAGSLDTDVMLSIPYTALLDATTGKTLIIDRFGVAV